MYKKKINFNKIAISAFLMSGAFIYTDNNILLHISEAGSPTSENEEIRYGEYQLNDNMILEHNGEFTFKNLKSHGYEEDTMVFTIYFDIEDDPNGPLYWDPDDQLPYDIKQEGDKLILRDGTELIFNRETIRDSSNSSTLNNINDYTIILPAGKIIRVMPPENQTPPPAPPAPPAPDTDTSINPMLLILLTKYSSKESAPLSSANQSKKSSDAVSHITSTDDENWYNELKIGIQELASAQELSDPELINLLMGYLVNNNLDEICDEKLIKAISDIIMDLIGKNKDIA